jgi:hypothetical protein
MLRLRMRLIGLLQGADLQRKHHEVADGMLWPRQILVCSWRYHTANPGFCDDEFVETLFSYRSWGKAESC